MSARFTDFCRSCDSSILERATTATKIKDFEQHECLPILRSYATILDNEGLQVLWHHVVQDRAKLQAQFKSGQPFPPDVSLKDKVLRILDYL